MNSENKNLRSFGGYLEIPRQKISELGERFSLFEKGGSYLSIYQGRLYEDNAKNKSEKREDREARKELQKQIKIVRTTIIALSADINSRVNNPISKNDPSVRDFLPKIKSLVDRLKQIEANYNSNIDKATLKDAIIPLVNETSKIEKSYKEAKEADFRAYSTTFEKDEQISSAMNILKEADDLYLQAQYDLRLANYKLLSSSLPKKENNPLPQGKITTEKEENDAGSLDAKPVKPGTVDKENVKKIQEFIINKFKGTKIGETVTYKNFAAAVPKAPGTFGPNTKKMIFLLKKSMGMTDTTSDITEEFISKIASEKIKTTNESKGIVPLFKSRIIREDIDPTLFIEAEKEYRKEASSGSKPKSSETFKEGKKEEKIEDRKIESNFSDEEYKGFADELEKAMQGNGTDEDKIYAIFSKITTQKDFIKLYKFFGKRQYGGSKGESANLYTWIKNELDENETRKVNNYLKKAGLNPKMLFPHEDKNKSNGSDKFNDSGPKY